MSSSDVIIQITLNPEGLAQRSDDHIADEGRRAFLKKVGVVLGGVTLMGGVAPLLASCGSSSNPTSLGTPNTKPQIIVDVKSLTGNNQALVASENGPDGANVAVVRQSTGVYISLSMMCTHAGCELNPPSGGLMHCDCHSSDFDLSGKVIDGPARSPLSRYPTTFDATSNTVVVKFK